MFLKYGFQTSTCVRDFQVPRFIDVFTHAYMSLYCDGPCIRTYIHAWYPLSRKHQEMNVITWPRVIIHAYTHTCMHIYIYIYIHVYICMCVYIIYIHTYIYMHMHMGGRASMRRGHTYMNAYIHECIHTWMHTYMNLAGGVSIHTNTWIHMQIHTCTWQAARAYDVVARTLIGAHAPTNFPPAQLPLLKVIRLYVSASKWRRICMYVPSRYSYTTSK